MSPQWPYLVLPAYIPNIKFDVLVGYGLNVEADGGDSGNVLVQLELIQNRCEYAC